MVDEDGDGGVLSDVRKPPECRRPLGLVVDGAVDDIAIDGKHDRHQVRATLRIRSGEPGNPRRREQGPGLIGCQCPYSPVALCSRLFLCGTVLLSSPSAVARMSPVLAESLGSPNRHISYLVAGHKI